MGIYNEEKFNNFISKKDYFGAANYLKGIKVEGYDKQREAYSLINDLEREGNIRESLYGRMDVRTQQAYDFINAYDGNDVIPYSQGNYTNTYGDIYNNKINGLIGTRRKSGSTKIDEIYPIKSLSFYITDTAVLDQFRTNANIDDLRNNELGINFEQLKNNQGYKLTIDKDNPNLLKVYSAIKKTRNENGMHWYDYLTNTSFYKSFGYMVNTIMGRDAEVPNELRDDIKIEGNVDVNMIDNLTDFRDNAYDSANAIYQNYIDEYKQKFPNLNNASIEKLADDATNVLLRQNGLSNMGVLNDKTKISEDDLNLNLLDDALDEIENARNIVNDFNEKEDERKNNVLLKNLHVTPFLTSGQAKAYDDLNAGKIKPTEYDNISERIQTACNRILANCDLTQYEVYSYNLDSDEGVRLSRTDNVDIPELQAEMLIAAKEGRLEQSVAYNGGDIGTSFRIIGKTSSKQNDDNFSTKKGEKDKRIFVKGLFNENYEDSIKHDTKAQAMVKNADMQEYAYATAISDTEKVGYDINGQPYRKYVNPYTKKWEIQPISEQEVLDKLHDNIIAENTVFEAMARDNGDKDDNFYTSVFDAFAEEAAEDKMPIGYSLDIDRIKYKNSLYQRMMYIFNKYMRLRNSDSIVDDEFDNQ